MVGVATGQSEYGNLPFLVALPDLVREVSGEQAGTADFLVGRADPVTWQDVRTMNDYGLVVQSRQVFLDPPPASELDPRIAQNVGSNQRQLDVVLLLAAVGLLIETTLLAGPAFAVSAARQRRSLALAASNGAQARQLRRYVLVGRLGTHLVLPIRLAARDTARQRGRSTPAVAAIMAAVAALTALSIGAVSDARQQEDTYQPQRPMGTGAIVLAAEDSNERNVLTVLARFAPQLEVQQEAYVGDTVAATTASPSTISWVSPAPPGCTEPQILAAYQPQDGASRCTSLADVPTGVRVGSLSSLLSELPLSKSQRAVLESGGALTSDPRLVQNDHVRYVAGTQTQGLGDVVTRYAITRRTLLPVAMVDQQVWGAAFPGQGLGAWILPDTATRLGWPVRVSSFNLSSPTGIISPEVEAAVADRLGEGYDLSVERGFQNESWLILLIAFSVAGLLVLVASLISTALSLAESQNDMATLAAVGATRHTRRGIAASQAVVIGACGAVLGVAVGLIPGIALTWPLTTNVYDQVADQSSTVSPTIVIPWLHLVAVCVGVPLLAGTLAWIAVRRQPQMTRRLV